MSGQKIFIEYSRIMGAKRGRPKKPNSRDQVIAVRVTSEEMKALKEESGVHGLELASWARMTLVDKLKGETK